MSQQPNILPPEKRKLIETTMETKNKELTKVRIADLKWLNSYYGFTSKYKKKDLVKNLLPLRAKFCKIREISDNDYQEECPICFLNISKTDLFITECAHVFCSNCIVRHIIVCHQSCPICRKDTTFEDITRQYNDTYVNELLHRNGIIKITQEILDTGLVMMEDTRYTMRNRFIWDRDLIERIIEHTNRQKRILIVIIGLVFIKTIIILYPIMKIMRI